MRNYSTILFKRYRYPQKLVCAEQFESVHAAALMASHATTPFRSVSLLCLTGCLDVTQVSQALLSLSYFSIESPALFNKLLAAVGHLTVGPWILFLYPVGSVAV